MVKVTPVTQLMRANHVKAKFIEDSRSWPHYDPVKRFALLDQTKEDGINCVGHMSTCIKKHGYGSAYHRVYTEIKGLIEQREQFVRFAKILGKNGKKDMFIPEKLSKSYSIVDETGKMTTTHSERVVTSKLKLVGKDPREGFSIYEALEPITYSEKVTGREVLHRNQYGGFS